MYQFECHHFNQWRPGGKCWCLKIKISKEKINNLIMKNLRHLVFSIKGWRPIEVKVSTHWVLGATEWAGKGQLFKFGQYYNQVAWMVTEHRFEPFTDLLMTKKANYWLLFLGHTFYLLDYVTQPGIFQISDQKKKDCDYKMYPCVS